ncbi:MAG: squalene/phytoene synthase family protein [Pseudomonadota bacterium]
MDVELAEKLPSELELALAYTPERLRMKLRSFLAFDQRIARIVSATTEPMLGQMRLAWWRDVFAKQPTERPTGDVVLEAIGAHWHGEEQALVDLVDGWEILIVSETVAEQEIAQFAKGRGAGFVALDDISGTEKNAVAKAATQWALADAAARISDAKERSRFVAAGMTAGGGHAVLPKPMRGLAVLGGLGRRALKRGGRPLMEGRGAALIALRAAILRR